MHTCYFMCQIYAVYSISLLCANFLALQLMLLDVSNNKIKFLPESIGSCFSLEEIQANGTSSLSRLFVSVL